VAYDVYIAYAYQNKILADLIVAYLESNNLRCWIQPRDIRPGAHYSEEISKAITSSKIFILLFSEHENTSHQIHCEVARAATDNRVIIPFRIENTELDEALKYYLGPLYWVNACTPPMEHHIQQLVSMVLSILTQSDNSQAFHSWNQLGKSPEPQGIDLKPSKNDLEKIEKDEAVPFAYFSITCPKRVASGSSFLLDVWAHLEHQREEIIKRALQGYIDTDIIIRSQGPFETHENARISLILEIQGLEIENPEKTIIWRGQIANVSYSIRVPDTMPFGTIDGKLNISMEGFRIAEIHFQLAIKAESSPKKRIASRVTYYRRAFISYSRKDMDRILPRIQTLQKVAPYLELKMDIKDIRSGELWKDKLREFINDCDIFYLFWSINASKSPWVEKEWRCAFRMKGIEFIDPFPLDSPDDAPPPPELSDKHFDEWFLAFNRLKV
jgi:hypothetical protein